jgi:hypothetical protein
MTVEQMYQEIGQAALTIAEGRAGKILVYAEVEDGVISCDEFYVDQAGIVQFRFCPTPMKELIYSIRCSGTGFSETAAAIVFPDKCGATELGRLCVLRSYGRVCHRAPSLRGVRFKETLQGEAGVQLHQWARNVRQRPATMWGRKMG